MFFTQQSSLYKLIDSKLNSINKIATSRTFHSTFNIFIAMIVHIQQQTNKVPLFWYIYYCFYYKSSASK